MLDALEKSAKRLIAFDMASVAAETESVISSVLLGALAGAAHLPFVGEDYESAIRRSGIAVERNLAGFEAGLAAARNGGAAAAPEEAIERHVSAGASSRARALGQRIEKTFPEPTRHLIVEGVKRVSDYQDLRYAEEYLDRLDGIRALDNGGGDHRYELTVETARHLALWMSYEDAIRVADLKTRSDRFKRVREEVRADANQLVYVVEFLHPRVDEISDIMPARLGRFIAENGVARSIVGKIFSHGRQLPTAKLRGFVLLYFLAGLRRFRRLSYRYKREMALIDVWLARIADAASSDYDLAVEIAKLQRLIKGYGDTHANGMKNFNAVMAALDVLGADQNAAAAVRQLTEAALADEDGAALEAVLEKVG